MTMPSRRSQRSLWRYLAGAALLAHGGLPLIQGVRSMQYSDRARAAYEVTWLNDTIIDFGGHRIEVRDTLPHLQESSGPTREDLVGVKLDGRELLSPRRVTVALSTYGLSRYHFWISGQIIRDRATNERLLVVSRRVHGSPAENPTIEVLEVTERGAVSTRTLSAADRRKSHLLYVMLYPLSTEVPPFSYMRYLLPFSVVDSVLFAMLLLPLPFISIGCGLWLIVRTARSHPAQTPHPPESPSS